MRTLTTLRALVSPPRSMRSDMTNARRTILADLIAKHPRRASYFIAKAYGFSGNAALTFEWLDRAFNAQAKLLADVKSEPAFRPWHRDPRYLALLRKMNLPE